MTDFLTEADFLGNDDEQDEGFYGAGLVVSDTGEMAIVHANGGMDDWTAYRVSDTEASSLAQMVQAVLG